MRLRDWETGAAAKENEKRCDRLEYKRGIAFIYALLISLTSKGHMALIDKGAAVNGSADLVKLGPKRVGAPQVCTCPGRGQLRFGESIHASLPCKLQPERSQPDKSAPAMLQDLHPKKNESGVAVRPSLHVPQVAIAQGGVFEARHADHGAAQVAVLQVGPAEVGTLHTENSQHDNGRGYVPYLEVCDAVLGRVMEVAVRHGDVFQVGASQGTAHHVALV